MNPAIQQITEGEAATEEMLVTPAAGQEFAANRKTREEAYSEAKFFDLSQDLFCISDRNGRILRVNPAWQRQFGFTQAEAALQSLSTLTLPEDAELAAEHWSRLLRGEPVEPLTFRARMCDGSSRSICWNAVLDTGSQTIFAIGRDVTDRLEAEEALNKSKIVLHEAQEIAHLGSWMLDMTTYAVEWSQEMFRIHGLEPAANPPSFQEAVATIYSEDRPILVAAYHQCKAQGTIQTSEYRILRADGALRWVESTMKPVTDEAGDCLRVFGTMMDITDRKQRGQNLLQISKAVESASDAIQIANADGTIVYVNPSYQELLGYTVEEANRIGAAKIHVRQDIAQDLYTTVTGGESWKGECDLYNRDGVIVPVLLRADGIRDEEGNVVGVVCLLTDVSERRRLHTQILQSEKLAALGEMVAGVAHEINNPLAAISGSAQLLEMHPDEKVRQRGTTIRRMTDRATRIVRSLLTFSRTEGEERWMMSLNAAVESALEICGYKLKFSDITLDLRLDPLLPETLANENQMQQIALNLITNAEHVLRDKTGGVRCITIETASCSSKDTGSVVTLTVSDNGSGIPADVLPRIFEPFFTTKDIGEGTGLGLSICHGIAVAHGGTLTVENRAGTGAAFTLTIPIVNQSRGEK